MLEFKDLKLLETWCYLQRWSESEGFKVVVGVSRREQIICEIRVHSLKVKACLARKNWRGNLSVCINHIFHSWLTLWTEQAFYKRRNYLLTVLLNPAEGYDVGQMRANKNAQRIYFSTLARDSNRSTIPVSDNRGTFPNSQRSTLVYKALVCVKKLINKQLIYKIETSKPTLGDYVFKIKDVLEFQCR